MSGGPCANTSLLYGPGLNGLPAGASNQQVQALRTFTIETRDSNDMPTMVVGAQFRVDFFVNDPEVMSVSQDGAARFKRIVLQRRSS